MYILKEYCLPTNNEIMDFFKFITCRQEDGKPFDKYFG